MPPSSATRRPLRAGAAGLAIRSQLASSAPAVPPKATVSVTIRNRLGLHARPAMSFVETASTYESDVTVARGSHAVDGKSIMQMMMLAATKGTVLEIEAEGTDADEAIAALKELVERGFDED